MMKTTNLDKTRISYLLKGALIGTLAGLAVSLFRLGIEKLSDVARQLYHLFQQHPLWLFPWGLVSLLCALVVGLLVKSDPNIKGSGIPQVEAQLQDELSPNWFSVLWKKMFGGILSVGMGLFLGREGPSIQLGASIGQGISQWLKADRSESKILLSSGAAAGLSAAFNAPIAALLFIVEEVHHNFSPLVWLTSFTSAVCANAVSLMIFGLQPVLYLGDIPSLPLKYYWLLTLLGVFLGIFGRFYQVVLLNLEKIYHKVPLPNWLYGLVPFLLVIPVGYFFPDYLGGGNQIVLSFGTEIPLASILLGLFLLRFIFSMISYGSGLPGGIFLPILTLGGILGAFFGQLAVSSLGMDPQYVKDFVIIAMAGYFAAIGKAPLTAIILVTEMVGSLNHLMPLGLVALIAYIVNDLLGGSPIYESLLERMIKPTSLPMKGQRLVIEYAVHAESPLDGTQVRDIRWPKDMLLVSIQRGEKELLVHGDTVIKVGDFLKILTDTHHAKEVRQQIEAWTRKPLA